VIEAVIHDPWFADAFGMRDRAAIVDTTELTELHPWGRPQPYVPGVDVQVFANPLTGESVRVPDEVIASLISRNRERVNLCGLDLPQPLRFWNPRRSESTPAETRVVTISQPGYSVDRQFAAVAVTRGYNAPCCPEGYTAYLARRNGVWAVIAVGGFWVV
jgi:hypothetical protein